ALNTAGMLAKSDLIPDQFRNKPANVLIAMNLASRLNADIFHIMQSIYVVHGRPAFAGQFYIACINTSGRYAPIRYEETKDENGQTVACRVITTDLRTRQQVEGPWVSLDMARKEGWIKNNPKWSSMPELMLRYRAAAFFTRTYCPDVTMGVPIEGEQEDISAAAPPPTITAAEPVVTIRPTYEPDEKAQAYADALRESATREELHRVLTAIGLDDKLTEADKNFLRPIAAAQTKKLSD
ncbi:MAG: hypothetical protein J6S75_10295, partial [Thermoguttaceae bacterium]|nr:hypothetical protein [Thermoguttaceae bacterium]